MRPIRRAGTLYLIEFLHQTTTSANLMNEEDRLYLIEFLHQTTTLSLPLICKGRCILLNFYIKPQPESAISALGSSCILLNFYIKPQRLDRPSVRHVVVSYWISTSNHNLCLWYAIQHLLYLIEFLHQTTTLTFARSSPWCCILLNFYIKPQLWIAAKLLRQGCILLNFYIKPQQSAASSCQVLCCILLNFYIKPQLVSTTYPRSPGCILLNFYIKPQHRFVRTYTCTVVSYWISTSNHNW